MLGLSQYLPKNHPSARAGGHLPSNGLLVANPTAFWARRIAPITATSASAYPYPTLFQPFRCVVPLSLPGVLKLRSVACVPWHKLL